MTEQQRISLNPEPPVQGQEVEITYDFAGLSITSTRLRVSFTTGSGDPHTSTHEVTTTNNSFKVNVPSDAEGVLVEDLDGPSPDRASGVDNG